MTAPSLNKEKIQWLHDACEEATAAGIKLTMNPNELLMFTSALLAAYEQEPVAWRYRTTDIHGNPNPRWSFSEEASLLGLYQPLYDHPAPSILKLPPKLENNREEAHELNAGVDVWNKCIDTVIELNDRHDIKFSVPSPPTGLHPDTQKLVADFSAVLAEKLYKAQLKYGYSDGWKSDGWADDCLKHFQQHVDKGDPRDVAAYCAFMWFHGWSTALPAPSIPAVPDEQALSDLRERLADVVGVRFSNDDDVLAIFNACRAAMLNGGKS